MNLQDIHENTVRCAKEYRNKESELLDWIVLVDKFAVFRVQGYANVHDYCMKALGLTEGQSFLYRHLARKSEEVPQLKQAVEQGELSVSKAKRILSVINESNAEEWIAKATTMNQKEIEAEVVKENPERKIRSHMKPITATIVELRCGIEPEVMNELERIQDVLGCNLSEAIKCRSIEKRLHDAKNLA